MGYKFKVSDIALKKLKKMDIQSKRLQTFSSY